MSHAIRLPCDEAAIRSGPRPAAAAAPATARWVLAATILGSSLAFIDGTVVSVALPAIAREFGASGADVQWIVESYALFLSALLLVGGSLGDHFGRRRVYAIGIVLFAAASIVCGLAPSVEWLVAARAVQGIGGALLVPGSLALISASFDPDRRGQAIGTWSGFSGITTAIGPVLGGWLVSHSWRWAFFLNIPIAAVVFFLLQRVPESKNPRPRRLDLPGAALATVGLGGLVFGLIESSRRGWTDPAVLAGLAIGGAALAAFLAVEARSASPMLPLGLFRSPTFAGANALTFFLYGALSCVFFFLPLDLIQVQGYTPLAAGASMLPLIVVLFLLSRWSGGLVARFGPRGPLILGPMIAAIGFLLLTRPGIGGSYWTTFFPGVLVLGFGMAMSIAPLTTAVMNAAGEGDAGTASGVNNAVSRTAGLLAIALLGILLTSVFGRDLERRVSALPIDPAARAQVIAERTKLAAAEPPPGLSAEEAVEVRHAVALSFVAAFRTVTRASAALALLAAACAWMWIGRREEKREVVPGRGG
ncbi:MAG TPA: MFS transporter [Candidatus Limnocylindrales bacterium]|nr:MFS transporter [Candidatus Limnocylindrales bacterium]